MNGHHAETAAPGEGENPVDGKTDGDGDQHSGEEQGVEVEVGHAAKKKKKKSKSRSKSKRGLVGRPSSSPS